MVAALYAEALASGHLRVLALLATEPDEPNVGMKGIFPYPSTITGG